MMKRVYTRDTENGESLLLSEIRDKIPRVTNRKNTIRNMTFSVKKINPDKMSYAESVGTFSANL